MFLKQLQLKGFKSFADSTTLDMEPGVTVVVGPNGSGKSNVVDAIGWVLGAQKPSAVRSHKMDDVIFAGSAKRPALGRAEVILTIDNSAGLLPIEFTEVTISRVLFRTGESEYAINGVPCRLLDVTELLSDAGVGRQQHVIISQGQIDAVLNSKPEERRAIIEEAAGILKYRKRKERSERRLVSTEANLTRLSDLLREVRRQLRPLEKQADAARRHGSVTAELHAAKLFVVGQGLRRHGERLAQVTDGRRRLSLRDQELRAELADVDTRVGLLEDELASMGAADVADLLTRYESVHQRMRGAVGVVNERRRSLERERSSLIDGGVIAGLEDEQARLRDEVAAVEADAVTLLQSDRDVTAAAHLLAEAQDRFKQRWGDGVDAPDPQLAAVMADVAAASAGRDRTAGELQRLRSRRSDLEARLSTAVADRDRHRTGSETTATSVEQLAAEAEAASAAVAQRQSDAEVAAQERHEAAAEQSRWDARRDALAQSLDAARRRAGAQRLEGQPGVLGTLLDLIAIDAGWERAFEAAVSEALSAVVVSTEDEALAALRHLVASGSDGAVLPLRAGDFGPVDVNGAVAVRPHARSDDAGVNSLLDVILHRCVAVDGDWETAARFAMSRPDLVVVTRAGERFGPEGWRVGGSSTEATGAALTEATERAAAAAARRSAADEAHRLAQERLTAARQLADSTAKQRTDLERQAAAAAQAATAAANASETMTVELDDVGRRFAELEAAVDDDDLRLTALRSRLSELEAAETERRGRQENMAADRAEVDERARHLSRLRTDLEVRAAAVEERRRLLGQRLTQVTERLDRNRAEALAAADRRIELSARLTALDHLTAFLATRGRIVEADLGEVRAERRRQTETHAATLQRLEGLRARRVSATSEIEKVRAEASKLEVTEAETRLRLEQLAEMCRTELDIEPDVAMEAPRPELPDGVSPAERVRELERELRLMGPINPLALQEFAELSERHEFLNAQLDDVRQSRRELNKVIRAVDDEIVRLFAEAFADVARNFEYLIETLFPGGRGRLALTEPGDMLQTGVEVEARPSGKNVKKLSLLSGGERSLVALAFLFSVFRSRPSPFYVMDEVEAALDDVNLHRFLGLIAEFRESAQLIIVSHQKRTMEAADVLYGVTIEAGGSSRVVSERVLT